MKGIAQRRHDRDRMISRAKHMMSAWGNSREWIDRAACRWADNMKKCSCWMCRNPRKTYGPTMQELRFNQWEKDSNDGRD